MSSPLQRSLNLIAFVSLISTFSVLSWAQASETAPTPTGAAPASNSAVSAQSPDLAQLRSHLKDSKSRVHRVGAKQATTELEETIRLLQYLNTGRSSMRPTEKETAVALQRIAVTYDRIAKRSDEVIKTNQETLAKLTAISEQTDTVISELEKRLEPFAADPESLDVVDLDFGESSSSVQQDISVAADEVLAKSLATQLAVWVAFRESHESMIAEIEDELSRQQFLFETLKATVPAYETVAATMDLLGKAGAVGSSIPSDSGIAKVAEKIRDMDIRKTHSKSPELFPNAESGNRNRALPENLNERQWSDVTNLCIKLEGLRDQLLRQATTSAPAKKR